MNWKQPYRYLADAFESAVSRCAYSECGRRYPLLNGWIRRNEGLRTQSGEWFCSPQCFERGMIARFSQLQSASTTPRRARMNRIPLGLLLHQWGIITTEQLNLALDEHRRTGLRIGECLQRSYGVSEEQISSAVATQWSCPKFPAAQIDHDCIALVPLHLIEHYQVMPVRFVEPTKELYIGCTERVPYDVLYAIQQMLEMHTEPCIITDSAFASRTRLPEIGSNENDIVMESLTSPAEMAHMTRSYAEQVKAEEVRYVLCGNYIWVRVHGHRHRMNLLYRPLKQVSRIPSLDSPEKAALGV